MIKVRNWFPHYPIIFRIRHQLPPASHTVALLLLTPRIRVVIRFDQVQLLSHGHIAEEDESNFVGSSREAVIGRLRRAIGEVDSLRNLIMGEILIFTLPNM